MNIALTPEAARVLGCLLEKAATTPDHYPLSLNALLGACNQSTNRDPVVTYDEATVETALEELRMLDLARRIRATGQRVVKHRHVVDEHLGLAGPERAVFGVLLLRGEQTPGELKTRTERWHGFRSTADVEAALARLATEGLVVRCERRPGQKEARWAVTVVGGVAPAVAPTGSASSEASVRSAAPAGPVGAHSLVIVDPASGATLRSVAITEPGEVAAKVGAARAAVADWSARPYEERAGALARFAELLAAESEECARITTSEVGKPIVQSRNEVRAVQERIAWNIANVGRITAPRIVTDAGAVEERVTCEPVGVVAHVSAWNYPYFVGLNTIVPALLAGNAVCYKPSEHATLTGLRLVDLLHRAGVPVDVVTAVVGGGPTGAALVAADVDMVCFTGSYPTGRRVAAAVAERMIRLQLELGGKDAAYVCDDVDVRAVAAAVAEGACYNGGQSCAAIERVYVHRDVADAFLDALVAVVGGYRVGDPSDETTDVGPLARAAQVDLLAAQVADARERGARVLCGGEVIDRPGNWFAPTVLAGVDDTMAIMRDESFGPVVPVAVVADDEEAVARMDDTAFGLGAAVFGADRARAERILARLDVGNAYWNASDRSCVRLPWSGRRHSGLGVSMGESGVRALVREKAWHLAAG